MSDGTSDVDHIRLLLLPCMWRVTMRPSVCRCSRSGRGKKPVTPYGTDDATINTTPIRAWWTRWTTVNHHRKRTEVGGRIRVARACASVLVSGGAS